MNLHIITGGSRGLGAALAEQIASRGDQVVEISRSGVEFKNSVHSIKYDLSGVGSHELVRNLFEKFPWQNYDRISLINNAGMVEPIKHIADLDEKSIARNIAVNLVSPMALTAAFLKLSEGFLGLRVVVNITTGVAKRPKASWAAYAAAKAGLECFSAAISKDYEKDQKLKVLVFEPGIIDTDMQAGIRNVSPSDFDEVGRFLDFKLEGRLLQPEVVAAALIKLIHKEDLESLTNASIYEMLKSDI